MCVSGKWKTAFRPEATSLREFWTDEKTSVRVPLMTHTGTYGHLNDERRKCRVLKLGLSGNAYMLLVLPHEGVPLDPIEDMLIVHISEWSQHLKEG